MTCALCSRYRTEGKSRCPGCSDDGYYTEPCKVHHCVREKKLDHCGSCEVFPCARVSKMADFSDLNTDNVKDRTCKTVKTQGFDKWYSEYAEKAELLTEALEKYNNGRMKRYLCELFIQKDLKTLKSLMHDAEGLQGDIKERGKAFRELADNI